MNNLTRFILYKFLSLPIPINIYSLIDLFSSYAQGLGWGSSTIKEEINTCLSLLKSKPKIFIDIGANKGLYTQGVLKKIGLIEMHIFEPSELNYKILEDKFSFSNLFKINKIALSKSTSKAKLFSDISGSGLGSLTKRRLDHFDKEMDHEEDVDLIRFDEYWDTNSKIIDYVKIDVEGHELDVLEGFGKLIFKTKLIQFEFGGCNIDTRTYFQDFWYFFLQRNFIIYRITPRGYLRIHSYKEKYEFFRTTNYIALNKSFL
tara:strand:+ start:126 stop:905 length:780 start_codon:yes stop_codon:yes gene_type:complete